MLLGTLAAGLVFVTPLPVRGAKASSATEPGGSLTEVSIEVDARKGGKEIGGLKRGIMVSPKTSEYVWNKYVREVGVKGALVRLPLDFDWMRDASVMDPWLEKVKAAGGEPLLFVSGVPAALSRQPPGSAGRTRARRAFDVNSKNLTRWRELIRQAILHYNREKTYQIKYLEVWNEPDLSEYWSGTQEEYFEVYRATAEAARSADPSIRVGGPAVSNWAGAIGKSTPLIKTLLEFTHRNRLPMDFISWHAFEKDPTLLRGAVKEVQAWKRAAGLPNAELFVDEWNYGTPGLEREGPIGAAFAATMMMTVFGSGVDRQAFAMLQNVDTAKADFAGDDYGMFTRSGIEKPVFNAFRAVTMLGNVQLEASQKGGENFISSMATRGEDSVAVLVAHFPPQDPLARVSAFFFQELGYSMTDLRGWGVDDRTVKELLKPDGDSVVDRLRAPEKAKADLKKALGLYRKLDQETLAAGGRWRVRLTIRNLPFQPRMVFERYVIDGRNGNSFAARDKIATRLSSLHAEARAKALDAVEKFLHSSSSNQATRGSLLGLLGTVKASDASQTGKLIADFRRKNSGPVLEDLQSVEALYGKMEAEVLQKGLDEINEWPEVNLTRVESAPQESGGEFTTSFHVQPYSVTVLLLKRQGASAPSDRTRP